MKSLLIAVAALALGATLGVAGLNSIRAATDSSGSSLVENLAEKFNVSTDEVKGVFEQTREERQAEMKKQVEENLAQAVKDGKITQEQKETIQAKQSAIEKKMEEVRSLRQDLHDWADENDVDLSEIMPSKGFGGHGPRGFGM
ncbi:MAG: hypothetical protein A2172_00065 [Candidatus Woykebacteria bacterium RBG_13_40_15]|uniref:DUF2680 domain-containing protein n=1 Tax=Candidatus Woykebacteria bacterium RBG_13_40_15 TaxID=1802593 RepID=A0A1G1W7P9_9BACT|nr:MAG: hypothetical protein A2172_00065 [Candidatus Woykebacteria bacterium RBG_13_40_15]